MEKVVKNEEGKVIEIGGVPVKATLRSAMIYKQVTGKDYLKSIMEIENSFKGKDSDLDITSALFSFFKAFALTSNKDITDEELDNAFDCFELHELEEFITSVFSLIVGNSKTQVKGTGGKKGK